MYLKLLEKMNLVMLSSHNYHMVMNSSMSNDPFSPTFYPQKILYFNTYFGKKLEDENQQAYCEKQLVNFYKNDIVLMPFFNVKDEELPENRTLLVVINV